MRLEDLTGQRFGRLTVIERAPNKGNKTMWLCKCDCGNVKTVDSYLLKSGQTMSCGCLHREMVSKQHTKHGGRHERIYAVWCCMKARCYNPNNKNYADYGGRGTTVCNEWTDKATGFQTFREWAMKNGYKDTLSIERKDVNGHYEPSNCRWATQKEQCNNRRSNHMITYDNRTMTLTQWSEELGINRGTLDTRINRYHWSVEKAFTEPVKQE